MPSFGFQTEEGTLFVRRLAAGALGGAAALAVAGSAAFACVSGPVVNLSTVQAKPGEEVTLTGTGFRQADPVQVRWNALDGPIVAEMARPENQTITATFAVPPGTAPGSYVVIVSQTKNGQTSLSPIRAVLQVVGPSGQTPVVGADTTSDAAERIPSLVHSDNDVSTGTLALVALGVAGVGMFAAGVAALATSRRGGVTAAPAPVKK
jgi:hypothetical protein